MAALGMLVFQQVVEAVREGSRLGPWNSETHSLLGRSHRTEIKMATDPRRWENPCPILKGIQPA
ncbi:hypothetical protein DN752_12220 [Echinicola strongylocentroti]|uniref:Uncharacterized protein n=1 Tax=Echinicola strongylocentroti TaxID=1795355 RepID=A0A2Z4IJX7_9BACT|nr:hypothetical protein DN752_12220 [Echinicola strongylocentroti]